MDQSNNTEEKYFKLLVPAVEQDISDSETIELCGKLWTLVDFERLSDAPPYTCISYSWGRVRTINTLCRDKGSEISSRAMPVLETVINSLQPSEFQEEELRSMFHGEDNIAEKLVLIRKASQAIWIDSYCTPREQYEADMCIHNMGEIYRGAAQVFVVWKSSCSNTVAKIRDDEELNLDDYVAIASDDWIDRAWTYPEFLNSKMMFLAAEGDETATFLGELTLLRSIAIDTKEFADMEISKRIRRLQNLIAEQQYKEHSAFHTMAGINSRVAERSEDRINAMIAVVGGAVTSIQDRESISPAEYFMRVCEENDDYSFMFSTNPRSEVSGRSWRPIGNGITPVISDVAILSGRGLSGLLKSTHLQMNNMCRMDLTRGNLVVTLIERYLDTDFPNAILERLRQQEFKGCGQCLKLEHGYFFPQSEHKQSKDLFVAVAHDARFFRGAPGLLLLSNDTDINQFCDIGVYIGIVPATIGVNIKVS